MIRLIGFDLDDTLWDLRPVMIRAESILKDWLKSQVEGYQHDAETIQQLRKDITRTEPQLLGKLTQFRHRIIQRALISHGLSSVEADNLADDGMEVFLEARNQITLFDGAEIVLSSLATRFQLCALSNGNADINRLGLNKFFEFAYSAEDVDAPKPAPDMFLAALKRSDIKPEQMIYVGDDPSLDVDAAAALGIHTVWLDHGKKPQGQFAPSARITDITMLPSAIESLTS